MGFGIFDEVKCINHKCEENAAKKPLPLKTEDFFFPFLKLESSFQVVVRGLPQ